MNTRELTCIGCPLGCALTVTTGTDSHQNVIVTDVTGYTCPRGKAYAEKEVTNPTRTVTSTVRVLGGAFPTVSVRTETDIPKDRIFSCIDAMRNVQASAPVKAGDVIVADVAGTGVNVIATRNVVEIQ